MQACYRSSSPSFPKAFPSFLQHPSLIDQSTSIVDDFKMVKSIDSVGKYDESRAKSSNSRERMGNTIIKSFRGKDDSCKQKEQEISQKEEIEQKKDGREVKHDFEEEKETSYDVKFTDVSKDHPSHPKILEEKCLNNQAYSKPQNFKRQSRMHKRYFSKNIESFVSKMPNYQSRSDNSLSCSPIRGTKYYNCRFKGISKISTYIGCTIHEYKLPKDGRCKKCKGFAIHKSKFYKGKFLIQHVKSSKYLKCIAFGAIEKLIGVKPDDFDPAMMSDIKQKLITEKENSSTKPYFCLKLIQPLTNKEEYIIANVKTNC
ncbi:unnamed protein product [Moneuplotes crassus]|uniref:Uncharacterized protein n=1 Tax=Euplotes crassus TaxID=5936 RepID=A0AAD1U0C1_EUPCR|nr:unnamed protein product [Moneuplotes crassus]